MSNSLTFFEVTGNFFGVADPSISGVINAPQIQPVSALATFTPRFPKGRLFYMNDYLVTLAYNNEQTVNLLGDPTGGTWTLAWGGETIDPPLAWDATPLQVQTALRALTAIGTNVTVVADIEPLSYDVQFTGALGDQEIQPLLADASQLTNVQGAGHCLISVTITAMGSPTIIADTAIALPPITGRIFDGLLCTIDRTDTPGLELAANSEPLNVGGDLIYDVAFSKVTFDRGEQYLAPFAFAAPLDGTGVCITDPALERLPYQLPIETVWQPEGTGAGAQPMGMHLVGGRRSWRTRAAS